MTLTDGIARRVGMTPYSHEVNGHGELSLREILDFEYNRFWSWWSRFWRTATMGKEARELIRMAQPYQSSTATREAQGTPRMS